MIRSLQPEAKRRKIISEDSSPVLSVITSMNKSNVSFEESEDAIPRGAMSPLELGREASLEKLPNAFESFLQGEWEDDNGQNSVGSLTPRQSSDPKFLAWIQAQGDNELESTETNKLPRFSCKIQNRLNTYLVTFPIVRVRERASLDSNVVKKLSCGTVVQAWEKVVVRTKPSSTSIPGEDVMKRNPWVRLKDDSGWVLTQSQTKLGTELMHRLDSSNRVESAYTELRNFVKEQQGDTSSSLIPSVRTALTQIRSSRVMQDVIAYQSRLITHLQAKLSSVE